MKPVGSYSRSKLEVVESQQIFDLGGKTLGTRSALFKFILVKSRIK